MKYLFGYMNPCHVFMLSLRLANKRTIRRIDTCLGMICATSFTFEPNSKYPRTRHKQCPIVEDLTVLLIH
jgi:hypothetical protein